MSEFYEMNNKDKWKRRGLEIVSADKAQEWADFVDYNTDEINKSMELALELLANKVDESKVDQYLKEKGITSFGEYIVKQAIERFGASVCETEMPKEEAIVEAVGENIQEDVAQDIFVNANEYAKEDNPEFVANPVTEEIIQPSMDEHAENSNLLELASDVDSVVGEEKHENINIVEEKENSEDLFEVEEPTANIVEEIFKEKMKQANIPGFEEIKVEEANDERIDAWIEEGKVLLFPERLDLWAQYVNSRANDECNGEDIDCTLEIIKKLEGGAPLGKAKEALEGRAFSEENQNLIKRAVFEFSRRGPDFWIYTTMGLMSDDDKKVIQAKKEENKKLQEKYGESAYTNSYLDQEEINKRFPESEEITLTIKPKDKEKSLEYAVEGDEDNSLMVVDEDSFVYKIKNFFKKLFY